MRITQLTISNFRSIQMLVINPSNAVAVFGMNGAGKSSIRMALHMALFGRCAVTDKRGAGAAKLIRQGAKEAVVTVTTDNHTVEVTITTKATKWTCFDTQTGEIIPDRATFWSAYGIELDHAMIAGMPESYLLSKELGDCLTAFLGGTVEASDLDSVIGSDACNALRCWASTHGGDWGSIAGLELIGAKAYEMRTDVNRKIKELTVELKGLGFCPAPSTATGKTLGVDDLPAVRSRMESLRKKRDRLNQERGACGADMPDRDDLERQAAELQKRVDTLEHQRVKLAEQLGKASMAETLAQRAWEMACNESEDSGRALRDAIAAHEAIRTMSECPTCTQKIPVKLRDKLLAPLEAAMQAAREADAPYEQRCLMLDGEAVEARNTANNFREQEAAVKADLVEARGRLSEVSAQLRILPATLPRAAADVDADIADTDAEIERGQALLDKLVKHADAIALDTLINGYLDDEHELSNYVKWFKDGEVTKKLVSGGLIDFETRCNAELALFGYTLAVEVDGKSVEVWLNGRPASQCSKGEQALGCYAIAKAFAESGAPVFLDDVNDLDVKNRRAVLKGLRGAAGCVWIFAAWQQKDDLTPDMIRQLEPVTAVWMQDGAVKAVAA